MITTTVFPVSHSRYRQSFCVLSLSLALLSALAGCGGIVDDSPAYPSVSQTAILDSSHLDSASQRATAPEVTSPAASPTVAPLPPALLPGSVIEFVASDAHLTLDQFAAEVRIAMNARESEVGIALQWVARYQSSKGSRNAYVTVVDVGNGKTLVSRGEANDSVTSEYSTSATSRSDDTMTPEQVKEVACAGGSASTLEQYYKVMRDYEDATEALAVGLAIGTPRDMVDQRLYQLQDDESHLPDAVSDARKNDRVVFRDQRYVAKRECSQR